MRYKSFITLAVCFLLTGFEACISFIHKFSGNITGVWFYTYTSAGDATEFNLTPASFLCLNPDETYTRDFGEFDYGKWTKHHDTLLLKSISGNIDIFLIDYSNGKDIKLSTTPGVVCDFEVQPYSFKANVAKPFSLEDNKWRIKSMRKESTAEIKRRLINHCQYWKDYFTWALDNKIATVDVRSTPSPIKIYGNGFELKFYYDLPYEWKNYFYDSADCQHANNILSDVMTHNNIALAHTDNKYKMFIGAFEQMEAILKGK